MAAHPPQRRAHDDGVAAHRDGADRLWIVQYLERLQHAPGTRPAYLPDAPQFLGLALITCGILALLISIWQYRWGIRYLWGEPFTPIAGITNEGMQTPVVAVAVLLIGIGLFAFFAVLFRLT